MRPSARVRQARTERRLTRAQFARQAGVNEDVVMQLEHGKIPDRVSIATALRLCENVGCTLDELFRPSPDRDSAHEDRAYVGTALIDRRDGIPVEELSAELGWTFDRTAAAVRGLRESLRDSGLNVVSASGLLRISGVATTPARDIRQGRSGEPIAFRPDGYDPATASVILTLVDTQNWKWGHQLSQFTEDQRRAAYDLVDDGLLELRDERVHLSEALVESLGPVGDRDDRDRRAYPRWGRAMARQARIARDEQ